MWPGCPVCPDYHDDHKDHDYHEDPVDHDDQDYPVQNNTKLMWFDFEQLSARGAQGGPQQSETFERRQLATDISRGSGHQKSESVNRH